MSTSHPTDAVHPAVEMTRRSIAALKQKSGRSLQEWVDLGKKRGPEDRVGDSPEQYLAQAVEYVDGMYAGGKAALRPLHDVLIELGLSMGNDVKVCPCSTIVPLYRNHVFAKIKPSTRTRIDFGLALGDTRGAGRLIETGGFAKKDRITHRVEITKPADIDGPVKKWLKAAYDRDAK